MAFQTGKQVPELEGPLLPDALGYMWSWYLEVASGRQSGFGICPISWEAIAAWSRLTRTRLSAEEVDLLRKLDVCYVKVMSEENKHG